MGVVVRNFAKQENTGLWIFPEKAENIAGRLAFKLDPPSSNQEISLSSLVKDTPFRIVFRGQFEALALNQALSDFLALNQKSTVSSLQLYRDGSLWQEHIFAAGAKMVNAFPSIIIGDQSRTFASDAIFQGTLRFADSVNDAEG